MKNLLTPSRTVAAVLLLGAWEYAQAQSLGTAVADALLGQRLDMTVPARFAAEDNGNECVKADVFYGETRVNENRVRVVVTGPADQRRIRIESELPIDEPVVTVSLRAGCRNTVTRKYTLLPNYPSESLLAAMDARAALAASTVLAPLQHAGPGEGATTSPRRIVARTAAAGAGQQAVPARKAAAQPTRSARAFRDDAVAHRPRLRLEAIDLPEQQNAILRVTDSLAEPNGDAARRAAAALLWRAINADPQEVLRTTVLLQKLEGDVLQLRQGANRTSADIEALRQRLEEARPWHASRLLVQVLGLLVLAAAAAAGWLWTRTRGLRHRSGLWYVPSEPAANEASAPEDLPRSGSDVAPAIAVAVSVASTAEEPAPVAPRREPLNPVVAAVPPAAAAAQEATIDFDVPAEPAPVAFAASPSGPDGALRVEALAAAFQEVEFLRSLGLASDAMDILKNYLQDSKAPAPLAYLALMQLCEQAEDPAAVAAVRRRYAKAFRVEAPRLPQISADTGLEGNAALSSCIARAWGTAEALPTIARALFAVPTPAAPLTLQTGRDLLALHELALVRAAESGTEGGELAHAHSLAPWAARDDAHAQQPLDEFNGGLDVNLDAPAAMTAAVPVAPELELVPKRAEVQEDPAHEAARRAEEEADAFSAAMASERIPVSRY